MESSGILQFVVAPLVCMLKVCGAYVELNSENITSTKKRCHIAYCILINVFCWADFLRMLSAYSIESVLSSRFMSMCTMTLSSGILVIYLTISLKILTRKLRSVFTSFLDYEKKHGLNVNAQNLRKRIITILIIMTIWSFISPFGLVVMIHFDLISRDTIIVSSFHPFQYFQNEVFIPLAFVMQTRFIIVNMFYISLIGIYIVIITFLKAEYAIVEKYFANTLIGKEDISDCGESGQEVENARLRHGDITQVLLSSNSILQHAAAMQYGIALPVSVMVLYGLIHGKMSPDDFSVLLALILCNVGLMFYITYQAGLLNEQVSTGHYNRCIINLDVLPMFRLNRLACIMVIPHTKKSKYGLYNTF